MIEQSHRKADPEPTKAERTYTPTAGQTQAPDKPNRDQGKKPDAHFNKE